MKKTVHVSYSWTVFDFIPPFDEGAVLSDVFEEGFTPFNITDAVGTQHQVLVACFDHLTH